MLPDLKTPTHSRFRRIGLPIAACILAGGYWYWNRPESVAAKVSKFREAWNRRDYAELEKARSDGDREAYGLSKEQFIVLFEKFLDGSIRRDSQFTSQSVEETSSGAMFSIQSNQEEVNFQGKASIVNGKLMIPEFTTFLLSSAAFAKYARRENKSFAWEGLFAIATMAEKDGPLLASLGVPEYKTGGASSPWNEIAIRYRKRAEFYRTKELSQTGQK